MNLHKSTSWLLVEWTKNVTFILEQGSHGFQIQTYSKSQLFVSSLPLCMAPHRGSSQAMTKPVNTYTTLTWEVAAEWGYIQISSRPDFIPRDLPIHYGVGVQVSTPSFGSTRSTLLCFVSLMRLVVDMRKRVVWWPGQPRQQWIPQKLRL